MDKTVVAGIVFGMLAELMGYAIGVYDERRRIRRRLYGPNQLCPGCSSRKFHGVFRHGFSCALKGRDI